MTPAMLETLVQLWRSFYFSDWSRALPWLTCALVCCVCALLLRAADKRLASAGRAIAAYRAALVVERALRKRKGAGFDWRDSHLFTRISDENALTRVWRQS